jgi:hypothetical protein
MAGQVVTPPLNFLMLLCLSETALGTIFLTPYVGNLTSEPPAVIARGAHM